MHLTAITCTFGRPEALKLCHEYMRRQTRQPDKWIMLAGPEPMREKVRAALASGDTPEGAVAFWEDDDHYRQDWLEWSTGMIEAGYEMVGEGRAVYYNVARRWTMQCENRRHAALCATVVSTDILPGIINCIGAEATPFFDRRIWHLNCTKYLYVPGAPADRRVVGIKGMPGTRGYSEEHGDMPEWGKMDPGLERLQEWIGADAGAYAPYHLPGPDPIGWPGLESAVAPPIAEVLPFKGSLAGPLVAVVQYWDGDEKEAMRLLNFLRDTRDSRYLDVDSHKGTAGIGYPRGANACARDVIDSAGDRWPHAAGILLLEADCVPVSRDWAAALHESWSRARASGRVIMGSWRPLCGPRGHINGNMIFDPKLARMVPLGPVPESEPWDVVHAEPLLPRAARTGLIRNLWRERFVPRARLVTPECGTRAPVLIHGVKDDSAWDLCLENFK